MHSIYFLSAKLKKEHENIYIYIDLKTVFVTLVYVRTVKQNVKWCSFFHIRDQYSFYACLILHIKEVNVF